MNNQERNLLVAERVVGWKWQLKESSDGYWTRTLLPPDQISEYTPIWYGRDCDYVDVSVLNYFNPSTEPNAALLVKSCMENVHGFTCSIGYYSHRHPLWEVTFRRLSFGATGKGMTLPEAIVNATLSDELKEILEKA